jgi:RNA methyltransferase, TrmH family
MMAAMPFPTPPPITSRSNARIAAAAGLRDRRERDRRGQTVVDGAREVRRALDSGADVVEVYVCDPMLAGPDARAALDALAGRGVVATSVTEPVFAKLAFGRRAEGIVAVVRIPDLGLGRLTLPPDPLVVIIEGVEKPGNIGAVLRSADGAGVDALVAASPRTDLFNPNAVRASAGTIFRVPLASASSDEVLAWARTTGLRLVAARVGAGQVYTDADLRGPVAIVLGAEADGLTATWDDPDIDAVGIPMLGIADSLNVSISAAVLLYEARRQRGRHANSRD